MPDLQAKFYAAPNFRVHATGTEPMLVGLTRSAAIMRFMPLDLLLAGRAPAPAFGTLPFFKDARVKEVRRRQPSWFGGRLLDSLCSRSPSAACRAFCPLP